MMNRTLPASNRRKAAAKTLPASNRRKVTAPQRAVARAKVKKMVRTAIRTKMQSVPAGYRMTPETRSKAVEKLQMTARTRIARARSRRMA